MSPPPLSIRAAAPGPVDSAETVDDCARAASALQTGAFALAGERDAAPDDVHLSILDALPPGRLVALRVAGDDATSPPRFWSDADGGPPPDSAALGPRASTAEVRVIVRTSDGSCQAASASIALATDHTAGARIELREGQPVVIEAPPAYAVRLRDLEKRVDELKERIYRTHSRLGFAER